jgi:uncharacterized membrane protein YeaQ/YmgE (transglycosylase-associated protein family)
MRLLRSAAVGVVGSTIAMALVSLFLYGALNFSFMFGALLGGAIGSALMAGFLFLKHRRTRQVSSGLEGN